MYFLRYEKYFLYTIVGSYFVIYTITITKKRLHASQLTPLKPSYIGIANDDWNVVIWQGIVATDISFQNSLTFPW